MSSCKAVSRFIDIGVNLVDQMYMGIYHGNKKHEPDIEHVLNRAWQSGLDKIIITGTNLEESQNALKLAKTHKNLFCSIGCHPTNCSEITLSGNADSYVAQLADIIRKNADKVVAIGEFGLDYDRLQFCPKETQLQWFEAQLVELAPLGLPLFLHCRNAADDLLEVLKRHSELWQPRGGVVHSFDGTIEQAREFMRLGLHIGINGCSLKTKENLEVVKNLESDRLLIETDSPWCDVRPSHAGAAFLQTPIAYPSVKKEKWRSDAMVKGRNEPCTVRQILEIIAGVKGEEVNTLTNTVYINTLRLFFPNTLEQLDSSTSATS